MTSISPFGTRPYQNTGLSTGQPSARGNNSVQQTSAAGGSSKVALSPGGVDLQQRIDSLGHNTLDVAQQFLGTFAQQLLGDSAKGATVSFDSVALEASSTLAAGVSRSSGANGVTDAAAFSLSDSSHFTGKGTITLEDGSKFDFELEVRYEATASAGMSSTHAESERDKLIEQNPAMPLPAIEFPDIDWPGSLSDLFKMMDKPVSGTVQDDATGDKLGSLSMRLLKLVNSAQQPLTYGPPDTKSAAQAYASELASGQPITKEADQPGNSAANIPLTISTTPPAGDAA